MEKYIVMIEINDNHTDILSIVNIFTPKEKLKLIEYYRDFLNKELCKSHGQYAQVRLSNNGYTSTLIGESFDDNNNIVDKIVIRIKNTRLYEKVCVDVSKIKWASDDESLPTSVSYYIDTETMQSPDNERILKMLSEDYNGVEVLGAIISYGYMEGEK